LLHRFFAGPIHFFCAYNGLGYDDILSLDPTFPSVTSICLRGYIPFYLSILDSPPGRPPENLSLLGCFFLLHGPFFLKPTISPFYLLSFYPFCLFSGFSSKPFPGILPPTFSSFLACFLKIQLMVPWPLFRFFLK